MTTSCQMHVARLFRVDILILYLSFSTITLIGIKEWRWNANDNNIYILLSLHIIIIDKVIIDKLLSTCTGGCPVTHSHQVPIVHFCWKLKTSQFIVADNVLSLRELEPSMYRLLIDKLVTYSLWYITTTR